MFKDGMLAICILFLGSMLAHVEAQDANITVETVAQGLEVPWQMVFVPDGRMFFTERGGEVRVIEDGKLLEEPLQRLDVGFGEGGLLGIALDPDFAENNFVYLYYTYTDFVFTYNKVSRFVEEDYKLTDEKVLIDKIPGGVIHDGGRIKFGPDDKLYITTGEAGNPGLAQDLNSLGGKILRINPDGSIPKDNPFDGSAVYSYGHRNPQGLDWDPVTGKMVITEHGPSGEKGFAHDEINVIKPGRNYGWPEVVGDQQGEGFEDPLLHTGEITWAPSGATFYSSDNIPQWENKFFVSTLRGEHLRMLELDLEGEEVISSQPLFENEFGRLRDAIVGPDGNLYILTSNQDGRGNPQENDDRILKIAPASLKDPKKDKAPLMQIREGTDTEDVTCRDGRMLMLKSSNEMPVCLFPDTAKELLNRGWAKEVG